MRYNKPFRYSDLLGLNPAAQKIAKNLYATGIDLNEAVARAAIFESLSETLIRQRISKTTTELPAWERSRQRRKNGTATMRKRGEATDAMIETDICSTLAALPPKARFPTNQSLLDSLLATGRYPISDESLLNRIKPVAKRLRASRRDGSR